MTAEIEVMTYDESKQVTVVKQTRMLTQSHLTTD